MLRARALVRLNRSHQALAALERCSFTALSTDQHVTTQMLRGSAYIRLGDLERAATILEDAARGAREAHPTIRAELALNRAVVRYRRGELDEAERLLDDVGVGADIVSARAIEYRGWIAWSRGALDDAMRHFHATLRALDETVHHDRYVEANALYGVTMLCAELLLVDDWTAIRTRIASFDWSVSGVSGLHFLVLNGCSMMSEFAGNERESRAFAREAEARAERPAQRVVALCRLAAVFRGLGNAAAHDEFVSRASVALSAVDLRTLEADVRTAPLQLAEECAYADRVAEAKAWLRRYGKSVASTTGESALETRRAEAMVRSIESSLFEKEHAIDRAVRALSESFAVFADGGYRRRAAMAALRLVKLTGDARFERYVNDALRGADKRFWMTRAMQAEQPRTVALTQAESAILTMLARGRTYKEIAAVRSGSWKTVSNHVQVLLRKFDVHSRGELTAEAIRRGAVALDHDAPALPLLLG